MTRFYLRLTNAHAPATLWLASSCKETRSLLSGKLYEGGESRLTLNLHEALEFCSHEWASVGAKHAGPPGYYTIVELKEPAHAS